MSDTALNRSRGRRSAWLAALLSFILPGVGQVYCGRLTRGLGIGLLYCMGIPLILGLLVHWGPAPTVLFGFLAVAATIAIIIAAAGDAYRLAVRTKPDYEPKAYNHPAVYVLIGLMIQGSSVGYALHVRASLFEAFRVPSASSYPAIVPNDRILVDKTAYRKHDPQRGDLVMFKPPNGNWRIHYIKRIVALEGDTVEIREGLLYVNGEKLPLKRLEPSEASITEVKVHGDILRGEFFGETNGNSMYSIFLAPPNYDAVQNLDKVTIPKHHCFVLGDNRNYSLDSRHFGPIPFAAIRGRADYIYWPADSWSHFGRLN
jgi:signal peptidase I